MRYAQQTASLATGALLVINGEMSPGAMIAANVLMARALAQQAQLLVLDEPTNHLDIRHQFELMNLIRSLRLTTLAALHELPLAAHYCDRLYLLKNGQLVAQGTPTEVLTPETIAYVYGVRALVRPSEQSGRPVIELLPDELL